jgi:hypothetical protein
MGAWGRRHTRPSRELSVRAELLEAGGAPLWSAFMDELRHLHLGAPCPARSVFAELQAAYEKALAHRPRRPRAVESGASDRPRDRRASRRAK